jgi:Bacterial regulatory proteins, tetR family
MVQVARHRAAPAGRGAAATGGKDEARRREILDAAFACFIRYGYAKVGVNDVAKAAGISRPLVYLLFKSKEDIFINMFSTLFDDQLERAGAAAAAALGNRERIANVLQIVYLDTWSKLKAAPEDLLDAAERLFPKLGSKYRTGVATILGNILGKQESGELLILAIKGLSYDRPSIGVLRKRVALLVDQFI